MARLATGAAIEPIELIAREGAPVPVPGPRRVHLQFRRFAGCPICGSHLHAFAERHAEIAAAGVTDVAFFHSSALAAAVRSGRRWLAHRGDPDWAGVGDNDGSTHLGRPADFLIDSDGTVLAVHCGRHANDQWSADELLELTAS